MARQTDRRIPLSKDRVLHAAMRMVDEGGIESLSMRKLGQALGVEAMSLYNHVANKDDILDGIVELVLSEIELPSAAEDWESAIRTCAISAHDALVQHPWACNLIMSSTRIHPARLRYMDSLLRRLREAGFSAGETYHAYHALDSHILGFTLWQLGHTMPGDGPRVTTKEDLAIFLATFLPTLSLHEYPYLLEHAEQHLMDGSHKDEGEFEFGLRLILDGLKGMRGTHQGG
jgi:AcrR family transcriptional regulator